MSIQESFDRIQLELPFTRLIRYDDMLVFSCGNDVKFALQKANRIISDMGLGNDLVAEKNDKAIFNKTLVIKSKK